MSPSVAYRQGCAPGKEKKHISRMLLFAFEWIVSFSFQSQKANNTAFRARRGDVVDCRGSVAGGGLRCLVTMVPGG